MSALKLTIIPGRRYWLNDELSELSLLAVRESGTRDGFADNRVVQDDFCAKISEDLISDRISIFLNNGQQEESWLEKYDSVSNRKNDRVVNNRTFLLLLRIDKKLIMNGSSVQECRSPFLVV